MGPVLLPLSYTGSVCAEEVGFEPTTGACLYAASNGVSVAAGSSRAAIAYPQQDLNLRPRRSHCRALSTAPWGRGLHQLGSVVRRAAGQTRTGHLGRTRTVHCLLSYTPHQELVAWKPNTARSRCWEGGVLAH